MARPNPLPASPHLQQSFVRKMVTEEGREIMDKEQWPPIARYSEATRPHDFLSKCSSGAGKKIAWPPHLDAEGINDEYLLQQDPNYQKPERKVSAGEKLGDQVLPAPPVPPRPINYKAQHETGPHLSTFKLREEAPMSQPGAQIVPSQPAFKISQPVKMRGDTKWPPKQGGGAEENISQDQVREFIKPKKGNRDYAEFFAQNALPNNYPGYRAPPGTQHHGEEFPATEEAAVVE